MRSEPVPEYLGDYDDGHVDRNYVNPMERRARPRVFVSGSGQIGR